MKDSIETQAAYKSRPAPNTEGVLTRRLGDTAGRQRLSMAAGRTGKAKEKKKGQRQGLIEYGMIMSLLVVICFLIVGLLGRIVGQVLNQVLLQVK